MLNWICSANLRRSLNFIAIAFAGLMSLVPHNAHALPSYARQTGLPCQTCHTIAFGPALTPYGQTFKLNAYAWGSAENSFPPIAAMQVSSFTNTQKGQDGGAAPHFASNDNVAADQTSLFYGGRIAGPVGAFVQVTYDGVAQRLAWDNLDIRFAKSLKVAGKPVVYGLSLNNNPTVQDLWNSTPAWSFPYESSPLAPTPAAAPAIEGAFATQVGGLTAYTMIDDLLYLEGGAYRELPHRLQSQLGVGPSGETTIKGFSPYWRAALQHQLGSVYASVGTFGMAAHVRPGGDDSMGEDHLTDFGFDSTAQWQLNKANALNANLTFVHENQKLPASFALGASANTFNTLNSMRFNAAYVWRQTISASIGSFDIHGSNDSGLYAPGAISGSASGSPNSRGLIYQLEYVPFGKFNSYLKPWVNVRLGLQYTAYSRFNGDGDNYDGNGRNAGDNNTLYFFVWLAG